MTFIDSTDHAFGSPDHPDLFGWSFIIVFKCGLHKNTADPAISNTQGKGKIV